jgi:hypothetical protein
MIKALNQVNRENKKQCFEILILLLYNVKTMELLYEEGYIVRDRVRTEKSESKKYLLDVNGKKVVSHVIDYAIKRKNDLV